MCGGGDGLLDGREVDELGTNPLLGDTDGDGLWDGLERGRGAIVNVASVAGRRAGVRIGEAAEAQARQVRQRLDRGDGWGARPAGKLLTTNALAELCAEGREPPEPGGQDAGVCALLSDDRCPIYPLRPFNCRCFVSRVPCAAIVHHLFGDEPGRHASQAAQYLRAPFATTG